MELTKFFQEKLRDKLEPELLKIGFFKPSIEKRFLGIALDVYSYRRKGNRRFAVWEAEIRIRFVVVIFPWSAWVFL